MTSVLAADESATKVLVDLARPDNSSARDSIHINFFIPENGLRFFVVSPYRAIVRLVKIFSGHLVLLTSEQHPGLLRFALRSHFPVADVHARV